MSKKCDITGVGVQSGNNVSHANNRTRRRFMPNLHVVSLMSDILGKVFKLKVCAKTLRTIEHNGGLDAYLESTPASKLTDEAKKIKKSIAKKKGAPEGSRKSAKKPVKITSARLEKVKAKPAKAEKPAKVKPAPKAAAPKVAKAPKAEKPAAKSTAKPAKKPAAKSAAKPAAKKAAAKK